MSTTKIIGLTLASIPAIPMALASCASAGIFHALTNSISDSFFPNNERPTANFRSKALACTSLVALGSMYLFGAIYPPLAAFALGTLGVSTTLSVAHTAIVGSALFMMASLSHEGFKK